MKGKKKIAGYVAISRHGDVGKIGESNVLWFGQSATLFSSYQQARNAVRRTCTYSKRCGYNWEWWQTGVRYLPVEKI